MGNSSGQQSYSATPSWEWRHGISALLTMWYMVSTAVVFWSSRRTRHHLSLIRRADPLSSYFALHVILVHWGERRLGRGTVITRGDKGEHSSCFSVMICPLLAETSSLSMISLNNASHCSGLYLLFEV